MFCGTRNCSTAWRPSTPTSESCATWSLSFSAGKAAEAAALSAAIGCEICGSGLTGAGAAAGTTGVAAAGRGRDPYQYQPAKAIAAATTIPMSHATLRRAALSRSSSHILPTPSVPGTSGSLYHGQRRALVARTQPARASLTVRRVNLSAAEFRVTLRLCFNRAMLAAFHPAVAQWFARTFAAPTPAQRAAWPAIAAQRDVLIG